MMVEWSFVVHDDQVSKDAFARLLFVEAKQPLRVRIPTGGHADRGGFSF